MNLTLLGKQAWRLVSRPDSLVARVYKRCRRSIGDGNSTIIGVDPWLPTDGDPFVSSVVPESVRNAPVSTLFNSQGSY
nr:uncharacterized protein LOC109180725 [Ipomoea trifida]